MLPEFSWSDSGLELLDRLKRMVKENGGCDHLANKIEAEWAKTYIAKQGYMRVTHSYIFTEREVKFIAKNYGLIKVGALAEIMGRDPITLSRKIGYMKRKGLLKPTNKVQQ